VRRSRHFEAEFESFFGFGNVIEIVNLTYWFNSARMGEAYGVDSGNIAVDRRVFAMVIGALTAMHRVEIDSNPPPRLALRSVISKMKRAST